MMERTLKMLPGITALIIIMGFIKVNFFYAYFHVPISNFLNITEIVFFVSKDLLVITPIFFIAILLIYQVVIQSQNEEVKRKPPTKNLKWGILISISSLIIICLILLIFVHENYYKNIIILFALEMFSLFLFTIFSKKIIPYVQNIFTVPIFFMFIMLVVYVLMVTYLEVGSTIQGQFTGTVIKTEEKTYTSDKNSFFIGRTEKYIFIFDRVDNSCNVIPSEKVIYMKMKSKN